MALVLELQCPGVGNGKFGGSTGQVRVGDAPPGRCVNDETVPGRELRQGNIQPFRGSRDQHRARRGTGLAQHVPVHRHGCGTAGGLPSIRRRVDRCLPHGDIVPGSIEFFDDYHRQRCLHALADLGILGVHQNAFVIDAQKGIRLQRGRGCMRRFGLEDETEHQTAARDAGRLHEPAPGELCHAIGGQLRGARDGVEDGFHGRITRGVHANSPIFAVARLIAWRIRRYVPQRQIFPAIAASISSSLGVGLDCSKAVAPMI